VKCKGKPVVENRNRNICTASPVHFIEWQSGSNAAWLLLFEEQLQPCIAFLTIHRRTSGDESARHYRCIHSFSGRNGIDIGSGFFISPECYILLPILYLFYYQWTVHGMHLLCNLIKIDIAILSHSFILYLAHKCIKFVII
jgi:hypothetical protein